MKSLIYTKAYRKLHSVMQKKKEKSSQTLFMYVMNQIKLQYLLNHTSYRFIVTFRRDIK